MAISNRSHCVGLPTARKATEHWPSRGPSTGCPNSRIRGVTNYAEHVTAADPTSLPVRPRKALRKNLLLGGMATSSKPLSCDKSSRSETPPPPPSQRKRSSSVAASVPLYGR
eukprot:CAMPEP_0197466194 /NCGR_PEP_ID=MMETSP1175-20131217/64925_1 /TAXON_ID=1003142 /ORGANISM="Triceratium dubium, Strain CCMP147" /LENGTH=111 /DNA_ID=CAMNT_0043002225 /DNA_START=869 /DNA_END=1204 /DNA_ORIENTATION=+